jgi:hypothetical protein
MKVPGDPCPLGFLRRNQSPEQIGDLLVARLECRLMLPQSSLARPQLVDELRGTEDVGAQLVRHHGHQTQVQQAEDKGRLDVPAHFSARRSSRAVSARISHNSQNVTADSETAVMEKRRWARAVRFRHLTSQ